MERCDWDGVRRLLLVRLDNIGDVILLGPAIRALRKQLPRARVTLLASPAGASVAPLVPGIDDVITYRAEWQSVGDAMAADPSKLYRLVDKLANGRFDAAVVFTSFSQTPHPAAMACYLARIPVRLGQSKEFGGGLLTHWVMPLTDGVHQADRNLYLLETAGIPAAGSELAVEVTEEARANIRMLLRQAGVSPQDRVVLGVPGASCAARRYEARLFAEAVALVDSASPAAVVVGGSEEERWMADLAANRSRDIVSLAGRTSIAEMAALVERADVAIVSNSAALHIADAVGTPVVALYSGAEEIEQWRPRHTPAVLLGRTTECSPCHEFTCPRSMECLALPPEEVAMHALSMLPAPNALAADRSTEHAFKEALG